MDKLTARCWTESSETDTSDIEDIPRERIVRTRRFPLIELDDLEFKRRFRINKNTFRRLENVLQNVIEPINERNQPISKANQILICLRFFATGSRLMLLTFSMYLSLPFPE
ncbi:unnamed protein product [Acanthoscelides obtectus]|uniref:Uncharacterized protein n=1 Tax=Acanthoscelides obtectus TaxID=200917 RepID=A0A9P0K5Z1_ACAOB|nr:unnamed protein product [Acanthoscelides obtectus]CAK1652300.1 hypothetical protein AOBTE_LOCUS17773 [Acanthoscelides obtectus]